MSPNGYPIERGEQIASTPEDRCSAGAAGTSKIIGVPDVVLPEFKLFSTNYELFGRSIRRMAITRRQHP